MSYTTQTTRVEEGDSRHVNWRNNNESIGLCVYRYYVCNVVVVNNPTRLLQRINNMHNVLGLKYKFKRLPTLQDGSFDMRYTTNACIADVLYLVKYSLQYVMVYICTKRNGATQIFVTQCKLFLVQEILKMGRFWKYILVQRNDPFRFIADSSPFWEIYMPRRVRADGIITASLIQDK
ncbi:unnamed protein product [Lepeophtheirus salmonis]|uniref:(salmon louse) hypothetical protein n=1 Tax=Lepeophtheirus salmonis TaxID=72036 RepID=A0A7R8D6M4_LEPSM|nr:unnamed protein product [Lepeophtheirus salmonis]CAF3045243.1 unnamed protein product [Lepeophtheirus salmonis]